jgi:hypothetical protein
MANGNGLASIEHAVVLIPANRSSATSTPTRVRGPSDLLDGAIE